MTTSERISDEITRITRQREELVSSLEGLEQKRQEILQEVLRKDGEIRILNQLLTEE
jgi:flagellar biosynthesis/type III secretory pathway chaperone